MATCKRCSGARFEKLVEVPPWGTPTLIDGTGNPHICYGAIGDFHPVWCPDCKGTGEVGRSCQACGCALFDWKKDSERKDPKHEYECAGCGAPGPDPAYGKHPGNQPCEACGRTKGTFSERGFDRCNHCGFPGQ